MKVMQSTEEQFDPSVHGGQIRSNGLMCSNNDWLNIVMNFKLVRRADNLRGWCSLHHWVVLRAELRKDLL